MELHHLTAAQARDLLNRAASRTHRSLREVADTVLRALRTPLEPPAPGSTQILARQLQLLRALTRLLEDPGETS